MTDVAERVLGELEASDPELGLDARAAWGALTWGEGLEVVTQEGVQYFLWYTLPRKFLTREPGHHQRIADAAAVLLARLGLDRYAEIARSEVTREVLAAWDRSEKEGLAAFRRAQEASGIEPPDTDDFAWGSVMGAEESAAMSAVADALEHAIADGELVPGSRGWRGRQRQIAAATLDADHPVQPGQSLRTAILTERLHDWTSVRVAELAELRAGVANRLLHPIEPPDGIGDALEPFTWLLGRIGEGVPATQTGLLGQKFVREVARERDWWDFDLHGPPYTETDVGQIYALATLGREARAIRRRGRRILLTRAGRRMAEDPLAAWEGFVAALGADEFRRHAMEAMLLQLLEADGPMREEEVEGAAAGMVTDLGWRTGEGDAINGWGVSGGTWLARVCFDLFGLWTIAGSWPEQTVALTESGSATALAFLRGIATGPRHTLRP